MFYTLHVSKEFDIKYLCHLIQGNFEVSYILFIRLYFTVEILHFETNAELSYSLIKVATLNIHSIAILFITNSIYAS